METTDRLDRWIPRLMVATVLAVAVFAFVQSYTHVYYLGQTHHQSGASLRMLPLSVDWLMFAAGLTRLHLLRKGIRHKLPLSGLALGAGATLIANIASGIIWGWETAAIQAWAPIVLFVVVELAMLLVRTAAKAKPFQLPIALHGQEGPPPDPAAVAEAKRRLTELRASQAAPEPSLDTEAMPQYTHQGDRIPRDMEAVDGPQEPLAGWGQLGAQQGASQGLNGIGLRNGRK